VLARKKTASNDWLVCAWSADGVTTNVTVVIPTLGTVTVQAVASGNLYIGTSSDNLHLWDGVSTILQGALSLSGKVTLQ